MPIVDSIPNLAHGFGQGDAPEADVTRPAWRDTVAASAFYNPVVSGAQYLARDQFPPVPDFDANAYGSKHELWNDNYMSLARAQSPGEFEGIVTRLQKEKRDRAVLDAAGGWGFAASVASGVLSPTVFIPLVGQANGVRAVGQTLALAGMAASADELALLATRESYTGTEAAIGIAAGTALGGLLGSAARFATPAERQVIESDMTRYTDLDTGMYALHENGAIQYSVPSGSSQLSERVTFDKPSTMTAEAKAALPAGELRLLEDIESGAVKVMNESSGTRLVREQDVVVRPSSAQSFETPNMVAKFLIKHLGKLNPVTRVGQQTQSASARGLALQMSDAGMRGSDNSNFMPHAPEGTIESRIAEYQAPTGQFTIEFGDAFSRNIEGDRLPQGQLQGEVTARVKAGLGMAKGKMNNEEFNREVFRVAQTGEETSDPNVKLAVKAWEKFNKVFVDYAEEAYEFRQGIDPSARRLFDPEGNLGPGAEKYVNHVFSHEAISRNSEGFENMLINSAEINMQKALKKDFEKLTKRLQAMDEEANIIAMTPAEGRKAYADVEDKLEALTSSPEYSAYRDERLSLERELRTAKEEGAPDFELADIKADLKKLKESDPEIKLMLEQEAQLKRQRRNLNQTVGRYEDVQADLLAKAEELEVMDLNAFDTVMKAGANLEKRLNKLSDAAQAKGLKTLWAGVAKAMKSVETQDKRIQNLYNKKKLTAEEQFAAYQKASLFSARRTAADAKSDDLLAKIEKVEGMDLKQQRELLRDVQSINNAKIRDVNARRALREEKLREKAAEYDPEALAARAEEIEMQYVRAEDDFQQKWADKGAENLNLDEGTAAFTKYSRDTGRHLSERIQGLHSHIAGLEILGGERGPELARVLNIPLEIKSEFLEQDMEKLARIYSRNMGPDIELYRATGSVNAAPVFEKVVEDFRALRSRIQSSEVRPAKQADFRAWKDGGFTILPDTKTVPFTSAEKEIASKELASAQDNIDTDLRVMVTRLRDQRGLAVNPEAIMYRMGRVAKDMNVARYMGSVLPSSVADVGRPVMRYGFQSTYKHGWSQFAKGMKRVKMTRRELNRMGVAWDPVMQNRVQQVMDISDNYASRRTMPERLSGFVANKTGFVAGFNRWTAEMKYISGSVVVGELSEGLARVSSPQTKGAGKWGSFLAEHGIDEPMAKRIWAQYMKDGGSTEFADGFRLPNTEEWNDVGAKRAMRAAVNRGVDSTIITPGIDKPNWVDENMAYSMVAQFQSFTFASTNRTLLSGAQQADMALVNGMALSLAMGAVSYYLWAMSIGGEHLETAQKFEQGKWADEAIARSGLLGAISIPHEILQKIPATQNYVTFGNERTTRRAQTGLIGAALGPSFDLAEKASAVIAGLDDPTQSTLHQARLMAPYQNVFWLRQAIDNVEESVANSLGLPERRQ